MATSKKCSMCNRQLGPMYCTGCDEYFCGKDFRTHREGMSTEMDKIVEESNRLQDKINTVTKNNNQKSPLLDQIDKWRDITIEKVKQVAAQVRQEAIQLLNSKRTNISTDFKSFSQELAHLKESENYVEHDLTRLNQMINQFKQDLIQSTQPTAIKLYTEQSDAIDWNHLIYIQEEQNYTNIQQQQTTKPSITVPPPQKQLRCRGQACPKCSLCRDWYLDQPDWKRRPGATCTYNHHGLGPGPFPFHPMCNCK